MGHLVRPRHLVRAPAAALHRRPAAVRRPTNTLLRRHLVRPSLQAAVGFLSLPHLGAELGHRRPDGHHRRARQPDRHDAAEPNGQEWTLRQPGSRRHPDPSQAALPERDPPRARLRRSCPSIILGTGDKNSFLGEGQTIFQPTGDRRHRARLPRPLPRRDQRAACASAARARRTPTTRPASPRADVQGRRHHHRRIDRGQERGDRRPRPLVRHRAAEVRHRRRALRQLRPRLAPHRIAGAPARR